MPHLLPLLLFVFLSCSSQAQTSAIIYSTRAGLVNFLSDASLERIEAKSTTLQGAINVPDRKFAFLVDVKSFSGFNSELQQAHFNENYLESDLFPKAYFSGSFVEDIDLNIPGEYRIRAKGNFFIHGEIQERIIEGNINVEEEAIKVEAYFSVLLSDHNIHIPKIVTQKISEEIQILIRATLLPRR